MYIIAANAQYSIFIDVYQLLFPALCLVTWYGLHHTYLDAKLLVGTCR